MEREICARIGTARLLLDRVAGDPTALAAASRTQAIALVDAVRRATNLDRVAVGDAMTVASGGECHSRTFNTSTTILLRASGLVCVRRTHRT